MAIPADVVVIDTHFHVWDRTVFHNENLGDITDGDLGIYTGVRYAEEAAPINLVAAVHVETVVGQKPGGFVMDTVAETSYVLQESKALAPRPVGIVAYVHLAREDAASVLDAHSAVAGSALLGARQIMNWRADGKVTWPQVEHGDYFDGTSAASLSFASGLALLASRDLTFDLHVNWFQLEAAAAFLSAHAPPSLRVVLDHVGCPKLGREVGEDTDASRLAVWEAGMAAVAARPLTYLKLSGLEYAYPGWMDGGSEVNKDAANLVRKCIQAFGAQRCMFASNFPVDKFSAPGSTLAQLYGAFWQLTEDLAVPAEERVHLFSGTARTAYPLDRMGLLPA